MALSTTDNLKKNIRRRIQDAAIFETILLQPGISNKLKSAYNRALSITACSIVEALIFMLIRDHTGEENPIIWTKKEIRVAEELPTILRTDPKHLIGKRADTPMRLVDSQFDDMIDFCEREDLFSAAEAKDAHYVRKIRNKIHLHKVTGADLGYNSVQTKKVEKVVNMVLNKLMP
jgi:hypothetical protein